MLGYDKSDLDMMIASINIASKQLNNSGIAKQLNVVSCFLHGLYVEGYFDDNNSWVISEKVSS
jgi:hypothetical protein